MKFADFICPDTISAELQAEDKERVVDEMTQLLLNAGQIAENQYKKIVKAVLKREELGSTAMGQGVAIPHAKHPGVSQTIGTVAVSHAGVDFSSLDGERVHVFFLLLSPPDQPDDHMRALESISRQVRKDVFCRALARATTPDEIRQLLDDADNNQFA